MYNDSVLIFKTECREIKPERLEQYFFGAVFFSFSHIEIQYPKASWEETYHGPVIGKNYT